jgi:hypothetical protein
MPGSAPPLIVKLAAKIDPIDARPATMPTARMAPRFFDFFVVLPPKAASSGRVAIGFSFEFVYLTSLDAKTITRQNPSMQHCQILFWGQSV